VEAGASRFRPGGFSGEIAAPKRTHAPLVHNSELRHGQGAADRRRPVRPVLRPPSGCPPHTGRFGHTQRGCRADRRRSEDLRRSSGRSPGVRHASLPEQVAWARFYLAREGLLDASKRGVWSLTDKGRSTSLSADRARALFLKWVRVFAEARKRRQAETPQPSEATPTDESPSVGGYREELLALLLSLPPAGFETPVGCRGGRGAFRPVTGRRSRSGHRSASGYRGCCDTPCTAR